MTSVLSKLTSLDYERVSGVIQDFVSDYVSSAAAKGVVLGLSGGLDSSVTAKLCVLALGKDRVSGLIMPARATTPDRDVKDAIALAKNLGIKHKTTIIDIQPVIDKFMRFLPSNKKAQGNLAARVRMSMLYYHAFVKQYLVIGTSDKSEFNIGYFTKFGDGGSDLAPIADLYKTQVRALGKFLDIQPQSILKKKSSPQLWKGHLAEKELGIDYEVMDPILHLLIDKKAVAVDAARELGIPVQTIERVQEMVSKSAHKRSMAKICYIG